MFMVMLLLALRNRDCTVFTSSSFSTRSVRTPTETAAWAPVLIYLDTYMLCGVYQENGICLRNHCGAEPPRDIEPPGLVTTVGWRDRASTSYAAADRVKAPARAARGRFRGIHGGRAAPSLPAETRAISGVRCLAGAVPAVLGRPRGCSRTPPRPYGSVNTNEKEDEGEADAAQTA